MAGWSGEECAELTRARRRARAVEVLGFREVVVSGAWARRGFGSPSAWLSTATGEPHGHCQRTLMLGEKLEHMPLVTEAFCDGELSEPALGLLADAWNEGTAEAFARDEEMLCSWACRLAYPEARVVIDTWRAHTDPDRVPAEAAERFDQRRLHLSGLLDGVARLDGVLDAEGAAHLRAAITMLAAPVEGDTRTPGQRRADALVAIAKFALDQHPDQPGVKRRRPKVVVRVDHTDLIAAGHGVLDGAPISGDMVRRLCCDAGIHRFVTAGGSVLLDYGRQTRTISDSLFDVLALRDGGCRWEGCEMPAAFCDAHHAEHWADGGPTEPDNLALLCWYHHRAFHEQHWSLQPLGAGQFEITTLWTTRHLLGPPRLDLTTPPHR
jgi:hypothetical protein